MRELKEIAVPLPPSGFDSYTVLLVAILIILIGVFSILAVNMFITHTKFSSIIFGQDFLSEGQKSIAKTLHNVENNAHEIKIMLGQKHE